MSGERNELWHFTECGLGHIPWPLASCGCHHDLGQAAQSLQDELGIPQNLAWQIVADAQPAVGCHKAALQWKSRSGKIVVEIDLG